MHQYPELAHKEHKTAALVTAFLSDYGLRTRRSDGGTGVIADVGAGDGPLVGFRIDMDALPIEERTGAPYASRVPGVMHACGHDVHTAIGLGAAAVLSQLSESFHGGVRFIFQPAEEVMPGGAKEMIRSGALEGLAALFGIHVDPNLPAGSLGIRHGALLASVDNFELKIYGKQGHAAYPHLALDAIQITAEVILGLLSLPARRIDPLKPVVLSITQIHGGTAKNILPESVQISGTFRTLDSEVRRALPALIEQTVSGITAGYGARYQLTFQQGPPVLVNEAKCTEIFEEVGRLVVGENRIVHLEVPRMGAEDFAHYLQHLPGALLRLGSCSDDRTHHPLHSPFFDVDERILAIGVEVVVHALLNALERSRDWLIK